jgi:hypothetical protein
MFVRFRQNNSHLQVSLVETSRIDGKVRHEHIASLGSVEWPPSVEARIAYWQRLHERLAKLSNRVDTTAQAKILGDIHIRIPMVTPDEQRALQLRNAEADERFWSSLHDMHADTVEGHQGLATSVEHKVVEGQAEMAKAAAYRDAAKARRERLERGEDVQGGLGKPMTWEEIVKILGWTASDLRHARATAQIGDRGAWDEYMEESHKARERAGRTVTYRLLRKKLSGRDANDVSDA